MLAISLEGGGARGAFQAGAIDALINNGYKFDAVAGTSIGALNGAMLVQGEFEKSLELWYNIEISKVINFDDEYAYKLANKDIDLNTFKYMFSKFVNAVGNGGVQSDKIKSMLDRYVDEDKIRRSPVDFGLMTYSLTDRRPYPVFKEDIPQGLMADFILASANFPGLQKLTIEDKSFIDGGVYENLPLSMLADKGYKDIIAVRTKNTKLKLKNYSGVNIKIIAPSERPGAFINFTNDVVKRNLNMGYLDATKVIKGLKGVLTYVSGLDFEIFEKQLLEMPQDFYVRMGEVLGIRLFESKIVSLIALTSRLTRLLKIDSYDSVGQVFLMLTENIAVKYKFDRLRVLTFPQLVSEALKAAPADLPKKQKENLLLDSFLTFADYYLREHR